MVSTNSIAKEIGTSAASVSDMLKKLQDKKLIKQEKYKYKKQKNTYGCNDCYYFRYFSFNEKYRLNIKVNLIDRFS